MNMGAMGQGGTGNGPSHVSQQQWMQMQQQHQVLMQQNQRLQEQLMQQMRQAQVFALPTPANEMQPPPAPPQQEAVSKDKQEPKAFKASAPPPPRQEESKEAKEEDSWNTWWGEDKWHGTWTQRTTSDWNASWSSHGWKSDGETKWTWSREGDEEEEDNETHTKKRRRVTGKQADQGKIDLETHVPVADSENIDKTTIYGLKLPKKVASTAWTDKRGLAYRDPTDIKL